MKIVKFKHDKFAIRRWHFGYQLFDLEDCYWHPLKKGRWVADCFSDHDTVRRTFMLLTDKGTPV